jgi:dipeptidyl aminopeptidase/acylaminoacyl peptidase
MTRSSLTVVALAIMVMPGSAVGQETGQPMTFLSQDSVLHGRLFAASTQPAPTVILLHGFPGGRGDVLGFGQALAAAGWNAMSFTFRGLYESEGTYTLGNTVEDVVSAADFLMSRPDLVDHDRPLAVLGWSGGGWSALMAAAEKESVGCAVSVAGANMAVWAHQIESSAEGRQFWEEMLGQLTTGSPARGLGGAGSVRELLENRAEYDLLNHAEGLKAKQLLIIGGWKDGEVTLEETVLPLVRGLRAAGVQHLTAMTLDDDHMFGATRPALHELVLDWLNNECLGS